MSKVIKKPTGMSSLSLTLSLTAALAASTVFGTSGTWVVREGVGTSGTNWATWEDSANWEGGTLPSGTVQATSRAILPAAPVYINTMNGITSPYIKAEAWTPDSYSVIRSDSAVTVTYTGSDSSDYSLIQGFYLYAPWSFKGRGGYAGSSGVDFCGDCTGFSGTMDINESSRYRFDLYANSSGETRSCPRMFYIDSPIVRVKGGKALEFIAPQGSDTDVVGTWSQTEGSPFLSRVGAEHALCAGTAVTGAGIPSGTFLKRIFPDGTIELSQSATSTVAANELTFAAFSPDFSASVSRIRSIPPSSGSAAAVIRAEKYRAKDKVRFIVSAISANDDTAANGFKINTRDGFVPATLAIGTNMLCVTTYELGNCEIEFTGTGLTDDKDFGKCTFRIPAAETTARILADDGVVTELGVFTNRVGTLVKSGAGTISIGLPNDDRANSTGAIVVDEGTLEIRGSESGDNYVPTLTVKAGATLRIPDGLTCGTFNAEEGAIVEGGVLVCGSVDASVLSGIVLRKGGACRLLIPSGEKFDVEVISGNVRSRNVGKDKVCTVSGDAVFRVTGSGTFDVLLVGGGGGGGFKGGGGGGGGGVIYTQSVAVADGLYSFSVGAGGHGAKSSSELTSNGGDTYGLGRCAYGGGGGGTWYNWGPALSGGSGGGGGIYSNTGIARRPGAAGIEGQGHEGGASTNVIRNGSWNHWRSMGGGGGGAGAPGVSATLAEGTAVDGFTENLYGGDGGDGVMVPITGENVYYGGGGGGGGTRLTLTANGGNGGGGAGGKESGNVPQAGEAGTDGTGGGGGGGGSYSTSVGGAGGDGGSGVVIIRFRRKEKGFVLSYR